MRWQNLFRKKSLEILLEEMAGDQRLKRVLGPISLSALGVGAIIGAGIFVMTGKAAHEDAGPAIVLSYVMAASGCALAALCYAEFAAMAPVAGSAYTYAYASLGEVFAWIIGWDLILEYAMSCATVASAWPSYLNELLYAVGLPQIPARLCNDPFTKVGMNGDEPVYGLFNLFAVLIMLVITAVLVRGIRQSAHANAALVLVKIAVVLFVIVVGWAYVDSKNWTGIPVEQGIALAAQHDPHVESADKWGMLGLLGINHWLDPIDDAVRSPFAPYGFSGIMLGAAIVFFAYIGFDSISTHAEEAIRPQRDVPIGIFVSLILCTILYIAVALVITGMVPYPNIDIKAAIAVAFRDKAVAEQSVALKWATGLVAVGGLAGMTSVLLVTFLSQSRVFLAMARDGLLPPLFGEVHPRWRTPHLATMMTGAVICVVTALVPIHTLAEMVNIGTLMAFVVVCAAVLILRRRRPDAHRPFRCPAIWLVAPLGMAVNFFMMLFLPWDTWLRLVVWLAAGLLIYFFYGQRHSVLGQHLMNQLRKEGIGPTDTPLDRA